MGSPSTVDLDLCPNSLVPVPAAPCLHTLSTISLRAPDRAQVLGATAKVRMHFLRLDSLLKTTDKCQEAIVDTVTTKIPLVAGASKEVMGSHEARRLVTITLAGTNLGL